MTYTNGLLNFGSIRSPHIAKKGLGKGFLVALIPVLGFVFWGEAFAEVDGRAGRTGAPTRPTCASAGCHAPTAGAILPTLTIAGPATLVAGATGSYTATLTGGPGVTAGIDVTAIVGTAKAGTFVITETAFTKLSAAGAGGGAGGAAFPGELIHSAAKPMVAGSVTFIFDWTAPATPGTATLFAAGLSTNDNTITVPPVGETGDEVATAQYIVTVTAGAPAANLPPVAVIAAPAAPATGVVGATINFDATGSNDPDGVAGTLQYSWNFGDGTPAVAGLMATHTFAALGAFNVVLTVTDSANATATATLPISIVAAPATPLPPVATITGAPITGTAGTALTLDGSLSSDPDGTIVSYLWNLGDGTTSAVAMPSVTYATAGTYNITLTVTDNAGLTGTATTTATIAAAPTPVPPTTTAGQTLFDDNCSGCHGPAGVGTATAPNIVGETATDIADAFVEYPIDHASVAALATADIQLIADYLAAAIDTTAGAALFAANCESCHGVAGVGTATAPNIVGESAEDILEAFLEYATEHADVAGLPATDVQLIADFLATGEESDDEEVDDDALDGNTNPAGSAANKATTSTQAPAAGALDWLTLMIPGIWLARRRSLIGRSKLN